MFLLFWPGIECEHLLHNLVHHSSCLRGLVSGEKRIPGSQDASNLIPDHLPPMPGALRGRCIEYSQKSTITLDKVDLRFNDLADESWVVRAFAGERRPKRLNFSNKARSGAHNGTAVNVF